MAYKQAVSVLVVIHTADLQVLLLERADFPGFWQSVTGSREDEESLLATARREVLEETGINAADYELTDWCKSHVYAIYPKWVHRYAPGTTHNTEHAFGLRLPARVDVQLNAREHLSARWLPWAEAAKIVFSASNAAMIARLGEERLLHVPQ